jgi:hypothetical protein
MDQIQKKAIMRYQENLIFFENNHPILYKKLLLLDTAITNGAYTERYSLEYKNEGYFDVLEIISGEYLYGINSNQHAQSVVDSLNFSRIDGVFEAQRFVDFSPEMADIVDQSELHFHNALWASIKIIEYSKKFSPRTSHMKRVNKLLFLGIGLGIHLESACKKMGAQVAFIKENDLELFRLSLFITNYKRIAKKVTMIFSVMEDESEVKKSFSHFLETGNNYNLYLKQISLTQEYQNELFLYQTVVMNQEHIIYPYSAYLLRHIDSPSYIVAGYPFLNVSKMHTGEGINDKPFLFLFSGPSTAKNSDWIIANRDRFIIITALSTCRLLHKKGIRPDIVIHIDPAEKETLMLFEGLGESYFDDIIVILSANIHPNVTARFPRKNLYFLQQSGNYKNGYGAFSSATVGEFSYALFLIFGAKKLYLLGLDLALDPETLSSHSPEHPFAHTASEGTISESLDTTVIEIPGNFLDVVPTYPSYKISVDEFARMSRTFKSDQHVYNLSNGALLDGADPKHTDEIVLDQYSSFDRLTIHEDIHRFFSSISSSEFRPEDREVVEYQLKEAKRLREIIKQFKKQKFAMPLYYIDGIAKLQHALSDIDNKTQSNLAEVYYYYFKVVFSYICEIFNTKELEKPKEHIDAINAILVHQLDKMGNLFISRMESYLKKPKEH